jgi:hypothetical protein
LIGKGWIWAGGHHLLRIIAATLFVSFRGDKIRIRNNNQEMIEIHKKRGIIDTPFFVK